MTDPVRRYSRAGISRCDLGFAFYRCCIRGLTRRERPCRCCSRSIRVSIAGSARNNSLFGPPRMESLNRGVERHNHHCRIDGPRFRDLSTRPTITYSS